jgi:hypothetical protein
MGNTNKREQWAGRERLLFIERVAWWRGVVNRADLREVYGISAAQASADLQSYQELNAGALAYNLKTKRYEAQARMECVLHDPRLEEAVGMFLGAGAGLWRAAGGGAEKVALCVPPMRRASPSVERRVFVALDQGRRIAVRYGSVSGGSGKLREIAPHALGHDGLRWHARAWCFENSGYRDFVLSRMEEAEWPGEEFSAPVVDEAWECEVTLVFQANRELDEAARKAIERDYGMQNGCFKMQVREAMKEYCLAQMRIPESEGGRPRHLDLILPGD